MNQPQPNILWIFCEDLSPWLPAYGDGSVPTPNIDALARDGVVFRHAFSAAPVCSAARSAVITGCDPIRVGTHNHVSSRPGMPPVYLPEPVRPIPCLFNEAGCYTYNFGKDDYNFDYVREDLYSGPHRKVAFFGEHDRRNYSFVCRERDWRVWRECAPGEPFFGQVTIWSGKTDVRVAPPVDPASVEVMPYYPDTPAFRAQIARHYDQVRTTDAEVGQIMDALRADGLLDRTWVFLFSDHGYELLRHKQFCYDGGLHVPLIVRPPDGIREDLKGTVRDDLVSSLDVAATTLAAAGMQVPEWMDSRDLFAPDYRRDAVFSARDRCDGTIDRIRTVRTSRYRYIRNFHPERPLMQPQYRTGTECYNEYRQLWSEGKLRPEAAYYAGDERPAEELYDHETDPHECRNLAGDAAHAGILAGLRRQVEEWIDAAGDKGRFPEPREQYEWLMRQWGLPQCWGPEYAGIEPVQWNPDRWQQWHQRTEPPAAGTIEPKANKGK